MVDNTMSWRTGVRVGSLGHGRLDKHFVGNEGNCVALTKASLSDNAGGIRRRPVDDLFEMLGQ